MSHERCPSGLTQCVWGAAASRCRRTGISCWMLPGEPLRPLCPLAPGGPRGPGKPGGPGCAFVCSIDLYSAFCMAASRFKSNLNSFNWEVVAR